MAAKLTGWVKFGWLIGFIGGLIAIFTGAINLWQTVTSGPEVTALPTTSLRVSYDPKRTMLTFTFGALLHNEGTKAETIRDVTAQFRVGDEAAKQQHGFNATQIIIKDGGAVVPISLPIAKETHRAFTCEISGYMTKELAALMQHPDSARQLQVTFTGRKNNYPMTFTFDMSKDLVAMLLQGKSTRAFQFVGSELK